MSDLNVVLARYAERAERFDEFKDFMAKRAATQVPLDEEERDMFSAAFKSALGGRRNAVRMVMGHEQVNSGLQHLATGYRTKVEAELAQICEECIVCLQSYLLPNQGMGEVRIFYLKMMGDYYRYMAEFAEEAKKRTNAAQAKEFYSMASKEAAEQLDPCHPTRLGLALNFSVFLHEVDCQTREAIDTAKAAFLQAKDAALLLPDKERDEACLTLRLIQENLQLWDGGQ